MITGDDLHRTVKLELEEGRAHTVEEAEALAASYILQVVVGADIARSSTSQATLLTAVNAAARAFRGGVHVTGELDWAVTAGWGAGLAAADAVAYYGGRIVGDLSQDVPTLVIGTTATEAAGSVLIHPTWNGWAGGVVTDFQARLPETVENPVAGVLAAGVGVAEAFQHVRGSVAAGRRDVGLSLWDLQADWRSDESVGAALRYLPTRLWLPGLGHLGQAYLWAIGFLPYQDASQVELTLQDFDRVVEANRATGLLVHVDTPNGVLKTRLAADAMELLGFRTRLVERPFDDTTRPRPGEPTWALAGFDRIEPRRHLDVFDLAIDLGLGSTHDDYLGMHLHTFPAAGAATDLFTTTTDPPQRNADPAAWAVDASDDACGVVQLQGVPVGAAFVGAAAAAIGLAELLRTLAGRQPTAVAAWALQAPQHVDVVASDIDPPTNPGYLLGA